MSISGYNLPKVAVLLASYQGKDWIADQLSSIFSQKQVQVNLTIADDDSTDGTLQWLNENQADLNFQILSSKSTGSAAANFFRLLKETDLSVIDYVALSDQDDIWLADKLSRATAALQSQQADAYSSNVTAFWPDNRQKMIQKAQPQQAYDFMFESAGPGCTFVFSKRFAIALQIFLRTEMQACRDIALHDWLIYAFARSRGYTWFIDPVPSLLYRQHAHNAFGANTGLKAIKARLSKLRQGWYIQQVQLIAAALGYQHTAIIQRITRLNLMDRVYLACCSHQYRRRLRDRIAFALYILFLARQSCTY